MTPIVTSLRRSPIALLLGALLCTAGAVHAESPLIPWVGTWSAAAKEINDSDATGKTLRHIVHTSIGGTSARIRLTNAFGDGPVTIRDIHIAESAEGSSTKPETDHALTVNGQTSVTLAAGDEVLSDPVDMRIPALTNLAISFYVPQAPKVLTGHDFSSQNRYDASGDVAGQAVIDATDNANYIFISNLDIQGEDPQGAIVALGASVTDGEFSEFNGNRRWPNLLASRLAAAGRNVGVLNQGISGNGVLQDGAGLSSVNRFEHDVLNQAGVRWVIFSDAADNDIGGNPVPSTESLIDAYKGLIARAHERGIKFLCSTQTPFEGDEVWTPEREAVRSGLNAFVRDPASGCDGLVDQDAVLRDPTHPTRYLPAFDAGDHDHPNDAGYQALADAMDLAIYDRPAVPPVSAPEGCGTIGPGEGLKPGQSVVSCDGRFPLFFQNDGNLVLYDTHDAPYFYSATFDMGGSEVRLEPDGELVVYSALGAKLWSSNSGGHKDARLFVQNDGNMVIYDENDVPVWASGAAPGE